MPRPTVSANVLTGFAELVRSRGADPVQLLRASRLPRDALVDPELRVPLSALVRLLESSAAACALPELGLRLSQARRLSHLGAAGLLARDEPDLRRALRAITSWFHLHSEVALELIEGERTSLLCAALPPIAASPQVSDLVIGGIQQVLSRLLGPEWRPIHVTLARAAPSDARPWRSHFGCPVEFEAPLNSLELRTSDLEQPLAGADPVFRDQSQRQLLLRASLRRKDLDAQVSELILLMLPTGHCSMARVSLRLGMDTRTLRRHLLRRGTSFSGAVEQARGQLALRYIEAGDVRMGEVAQRLGFSDASAFTRWFGRRFGCPPTAWRGQSR